MRPIDALLDQYSDDHRNHTNQAIHLLCVPAIVWSVSAMLFTIPVPPGWFRPGAFAGFALDYQVTGRFGECLDRLKVRLADPVGDRVIEGVAESLARELTAAGLTLAMVQLPASGAATIFFAYIGFDAVSTAAQEAKNPQKDMPRGILGSLIICTIIYILVGFVMTGMVNYKLLNVPDPVAVAVNAGGDSLYWLRFPIKIGALAGLSSVILVMLMGQPRIFYSMSKDGLLPKFFSKIHLNSILPISQLLLQVP